MKQINLLPTSIRQHEVQGRTISLITVAAMLGLAAVGGCWFFLKAEVDAAKESQQRLSQAQVAMKNPGSGKAGAQVVDKDLVTRVSQLNSFASTEVLWPRFFAGVGKTVPKDTRLSSLVYAFSQGSGTLQVVGESPSNLSFATFVEALKGNTFLTTPKVGAYGYNAAKGTVSFSISGTIPLNQIDYSKQP